MSIATLDPTLPTLDLTDNEHAMIGALVRQLRSERWELELRDAYYRGNQLIRDLGISLPPQLRGLHIVVEWPAIAVDAMEERLDVEGFRYPGADDGDENLWNIWQANDLDEESQLANLDALLFGRGYVAVGSGTCGSDVPDCPALITVESPLDMTCAFDARTRTVSTALRLWEANGVPMVTLYRPDQTLIASADERGEQWRLEERDVHNLGVTPVVRIANRQRTHDRVGASEITRGVMSITDAACRTMIGAEVSREFYGAPQRYILGASEESFQSPDGTPRSAWETYLGRVLALERDENGDMPTVGQFAAASPTPYTEIINMYAQQFASRTGLPPHYLGLTTVNPPSADAIRSSEARLVKRVERRQRTFGGPWEAVMRLAMLVMTGDVPPEAHRMETMWADAATPTIAETTDAIIKQVQSGLIPAQSDVALERLGYSTAERARIALERRRDAGTQFLAQIATSLQAREARVDKSLAGDLGVHPAPPPPPPPVTSDAGSGNSGAGG